MVLTDCESYFLNRARLETRLGINELHGVPLFLRFSVKFANVSVKFGSLHVQTRNNWDYMFFIACTFHYHVAHVTRKKMKAFGLNIWFMQSYRNSDFVVIYALFPPKMVYFKSAVETSHIWQKLPWIVEILFKRKYWFFHDVF